MKFFAATLTIASAMTVTMMIGSATVWAAGAQKIDCSKAAKGLVKIESNGERLSVEKGAMLAYECLVKSNRKVSLNKKNAIKKSLEESAEQCGQTDPLQSLILSSWNADRASVSEENGKTYFTQSGESSVLVREPITCSGIGTGLFGGINAAASIILDVEDSVKFSAEEDDTGPIEQVLSVKLEKLAGI